MRLTTFVFSFLNPKYIGLTSGKMHQNSHRGPDGKQPFSFEQEKVAQPNNAIAAANALQVSKSRVAQARGLLLQSRTLSAEEACGV